MASADPNTIRVVIVEDYKIIRVGLRTLLQKDPCLQIVGESEDGRQALDLIKSVKPDLVLMDLGLPSMDGIELTRHLKAFDENIKIIILTSHDKEEEVVSALKAGANAYCLKDIPSPRLLELIRAVYEGAAWLDPAIAKVAFNIFNRMGHVGIEVAANDSIQLSDREQSVLKLLVEGKNNNEIANTLYISVHTVKAHVGNILQKLCVEDRVQAAVKAIKEGLV